MSHINCFIQGEVVGFQVLLDSLYPRFHIVRGHPSGPSSSSEGKKRKLLRTDWYLFHLAFTQCGRTGRNAVVGR